MLSINTNLSSLIAQSSMKTSTDKLNQAIEKMTTGFKINHAKDNAANYSISTNLTTQLSAYDTAADNVAMGMDLVNYASDIISQMQDKAARLNALSTQARNGTYGAQSLNALNNEANAIMSELMRLYSTAEYNDISLFNRTAYELTPEHKALTESLQNTVVAKEEYNGFIADPKHPNGDAYVDGLTSVTEAIAAGSLTSGGEYKVGGVDDLKALATYVNSGNNASGMTFIMSEDIDLSGEANWTPIGDYSTNYNYVFRGIFDGNGHVIKNLKIDRETSDYQGLFGRAESGEIKNVGLENVDIKGKGSVGGLAGYADSSTITNSYATGNLSGQGSVGGLAGTAGSISNSYATGSVTGTERVGGLAGQTYSSISNSYATGNVSGTDYNVGGLVGSGSTISNSYATGSVHVTGMVSRPSIGFGGLAGSISGNITNSYATGNVIANVINENNYEIGVGGLVGHMTSNTIENCYSTGTVSSQNNVGGLIGYLDAPGSTITHTNCASYSKVIGEDVNSTGSYIGSFKTSVYYMGGAEATLSLTNCKVLPQDMNLIGGCYKRESSGTVLIQDYDLSNILAGVSYITPQFVATNLQVGIYGNSSSQLSFDTNFSFDLNLDSGIESVEAFNAIVAFENLLSEKATQLGAVQNRLDSALESIEVNINNLTSTRSTIRDADIAEVSSQYIQQQILQQAAATLMATANQSPSIGLQLI